MLPQKIKFIFRIFLFLTSNLACTVVHGQLTVKSNAIHIPMGNTQGQYIPLLIEKFSQPNNRKSDQYGYIYIHTKTKDTLLKDTFDEATPFYNGYACVRIDSFYHRMDIQGNKTQFPGSFSNNSTNNFKQFIFNVKDEYGVCDETGKIIVPSKYEEINLINIPKNEPQTHQPKHIIEAVRRAKDYMNSRIYDIYDFQGELLYSHLHSFYQEFDRQFDHPILKNHQKNRINPGYNQMDSAFYHQIDSMLNRKIFRVKDSLGKESIVKFEYRKGRISVEHLSEFNEHLIYRWTKGSYFQPSNLFMLFEKINPNDKNTARINNCFGTKLIDSVYLNSVYFMYDEQDVINERSIGLVIFYQKLYQPDQTWIKVVNFNGDEIANVRSNNYELYHNEYGISQIEIDDVIYDFTYGMIEANTYYKSELIKQIQYKKFIEHKFNRKFNLSDILFFNKSRKGIVSDEENSTYYIDNDGIRPLHGFLGIINSDEIVNIKKHAYHEFLEIQLQNYSQGSYYLLYDLKNNFLLPEKLSDYQIKNEYITTLNLEKGLKRWKCHSLNTSQSVNINSRVDSVVFGAETILIFTPDSLLQINFSFQRINEWTLKNLEGKEIYKNELGLFMWENENQIRRLLDRNINLNKIYDYNLSTQSLLIESLEKQNVLITFHGEQYKVGKGDHFNFVELFTKDHHAPVSENDFDAFVNSKGQLCWRLKKKIQLNLGDYVGVAFSKSRQDTSIHPFQFQYLVSTMNKTYAINGHQLVHVFPFGVHNQIDMEPHVNTNHLIWENEKQAGSFVALLSMTDELILLNAYSLNYYSFSSLNYGSFLGIKKVPGDHKAFELTFEDPERDYIKLVQLIDKKEKLVPIKFDETLKFPQLNYYIEVNQGNIYRNADFLLKFDGFLEDIFKSNNNIEDSSPVIIYSEMSYKKPGNENNLLVFDSRGNYRIFNFKKSKIDASFGSSLSLDDFQSNHIFNFHFRLPGDEYKVIYGDLDGKLYFDQNINLKYSKRKD